MPRHRRSSNMQLATAQAASEFEWIHGRRLRVHRAEDGQLQLQWTSCAEAHHAMYGLRLPSIPNRRVVVSEIHPISGSVMTSNERANAVKNERKARLAPIFTAHACLQIEEMRLCRESAPACRPNSPTSGAMQNSHAFIFDTLHCVSVFRLHKGVWWQPLLSHARKLLKCLPKALNRVRARVTCV